MLVIAGGIILAVIILANLQLCFSIFWALLQVVLWFSIFGAMVLAAVIAANM